jgi:hypothetical protein
MPISPPTLCKVVMRVRDYSFSQVCAASRAVPSNRWSSSAIVDTRDEDVVEFLLDPDQVEAFLAEVRGDEPALGDPHRGGPSSRWHPAKQRADRGRRRPRKRGALGGQGSSSRVRGAGRACSTGAKAVRLPQVARTQGQAPPGSADSYGEKRGSDQPNERFLVG